MILATAGCGVALPDPAPDAEARPICAALMADLPSTVLDGDRRSVQPGVFGAAWGRPAITLRCGVPKPPALDRASQCLEVNGVGWFAQPVEGGYVFTTIGRPAYVEVGVPSEYAPEANALVAVADAVARHDPAEQPCV